MNGKIIKVDAAGGITLHDWIDGDYSEQNRLIRTLIGEKCELYEHVMPARLYSNLGVSRDHEEGNVVSMLLDEEGLYHDLELNLLGTWLYGQPIMGNIVFVGEYMTDDGLDFGPVQSDQVNYLIYMFKKIIKGLEK